MVARERQRITKAIKIHTMKSQGIIKVIKIHPLGTMDICTKFHGKPRYTC